VSELGQLLRKARIEKGLTLEEIQETTKIRIRYLEAIEEGNFNILPGSFYVRAFIKSYSEAVGLNPDEILKLYSHVIPASGNEQHTERISRKRKAISNTDIISKWASTIVMWSFPLLIIGLIWYYFYSNYSPNDNDLNDRPPITDHAGQNQASPSPDTPAPEPDPEPQPAPEPQPQPVEETKPEVQVAKTSTQGTNIIYTVTNTEKLDLQINFTERCWIRIRKNNGDGEIIHDANHPKDDTYIWQGDHSVWIRLGFPKGAQIIVNGIPLEIIDDTRGWNVQINLE
jgi:cytoskeletal protein RodZ